MLKKKKNLTENEINYTWNPGHLLQRWGHTCWQVCNALIIFFPTGIFYRENPVLCFYLLLNQLCLIICYFGNRDRCVDGFDQNAVKSLL